MRPLALLLFPAFLSPAVLSGQPDARELLLRANDVLKKYSSYHIHSLSEVETTGGNNTISSVPEPATYGFTGAALLAGTFLLPRARNK